MKKIISLVLVSIIFCSSVYYKDAWGFYGHRLINELAVMTLPEEVIPFYKKNISYIIDHSVDPDKRRYATSFEAIRHYIDIDHWGEPPFDNLPRNWMSALAKTTSVDIVISGDTLEVFSDDLMGPMSDSIEINYYCGGSMLAKRVSFKTWRSHFRKYIFSQYYEDVWLSSSSDMYQFLGLENCSEDYDLLWHDRVSEYGVVPWHLQYMQYRLTNAFKEKNLALILRLSAEIGHYIGDAHVPLHTTLNYNGQLTDQIGIHAFWESRIPELFAEEQYDFIVGRAEYIENPMDYYWEIVLESHSYVDSVLLIEKRLKETWPEDEIYCFDQRLNRVIKTECREFAAAYQSEMNNMVEARMRKSIKAIGSSWFTAWVDAGQPELLDINEIIDSVRTQELSPPTSSDNQSVDDKKFKIRKHE